MSKSKIFLVVLLSPMLLWARPRPFVPPEGAVPPNVQVTVDGMSGTGCPQGTASVALSPDSSVVSVLFDQFVTEIHAADPERRLRRNCQINLRIWFTGKYRVAIVGSDIRAFAGIPAQARSSIKIQHTSQLADGEQIKKMDMNHIVQGPISEDLFLQARFHGKPIWSNCGSQLGGQGFPIMGINMIIDSVNRNPSESLITTIDSVDLNANPGLQYHLKWRPDNKSCP